MARLSQKELEGAIARQQKPSRTALNKAAKPDVILYTLFGRHKEIDEEGNPIVYDENKAYAKQVLQGTRYVYFVKVGNSGHLFDPLGLYASREESKLSMTRGKPEIRFVQTNQKVFDHYIAFLRTKNKAHLSYATREM